jgi:alpha-beta hydrolase superfamily lysophospholipase
LSRRAEVVQAYRDDPLVYHGRMLARTGAELVRNSREIAGRVSRITAPLLAMHGSADRLTDPAGSRRLYEQAASSDKTFKLYEGLYHELLHEPERQQVMTDLVDWLRAHC